MAPLGILRGAVTTLVTEHPRRRGVAAGVVRPQAAAVRPGRRHRGWTRPVTARRTGVRQLPPRAAPAAPARPRDGAARWIMDQSMGFWDRLSAHVSFFLHFITRVQGPETLIVIIAICRTQHHLKIPLAAIAVPPLYHRSLVTTVG